MHHHRPPPFPPSATALIALPNCVKVLRLAPICPVDKPSPLPLFVATHVALPRGPIPCRLAALHLPSTCPLPPCPALPRSLSELEYVASQIQLAPRNEASWTFLAGLFSCLQPWASQPYALARWPEVDTICREALQVQGRSGCSRVQIGGRPAKQRHTLPCCCLLRVHWVVQGQDLAGCCKDFDAGPTAPPAVAEARRCASSPGHCRGRGHGLVPSAPTRVCQGCWLACAAA